ncbi:MAG: hypothetical protein M0R80_09855 [Proteobacteria bacterium]|nr:hypothetical protein [Pseudomonadota bacterium]
MEDTTENSKICPFSLSSGNLLYCTEGRIGNQRVGILGEEICRAWSPELKFGDTHYHKKIGNGCHYRPGYCMLIPASEPDVTFLPNIFLDGD